MKKSIIIFFLLLLNLYSFDLDSDYLKKIVEQNPNDIENRLVLSRYFYEKENYNEALSYVQEVLKIDAKEKQAFNLKQRILEDYKTDEILKENKIYNIHDKVSINRLFDRLYRDKDYTLYIKLYDYLNSKKITLRRKNHIEAVEIFYKKRDYKRAKKLLNRANLQNNTHAIKLNILICKAQNDQICVISKYKKLLSNEFSKDEALELFDIYFKNKNLKESNALFLKLKKGYIDENEILVLERKLKKLNLHTLERSRESYLKKNTYNSLNIYAMTLCDLNKKDEALKVVKEFTRENPENAKSKLLLSKLYSWNNNQKYSYEILEDLIDESKDLEALQIYAKKLFSQNRYAKARKYYDILIKQESDVNKVNDYKIKREFCNLRVQENRNRENIQNLLKSATKYKNSKQTEKAIVLYKKYYHISKRDDVLKLIADLYYFDKKFGFSLAYYERYLKIKPNDFAARERYATALEKKKMYKEAAQEFQLLSSVPSSKQNNFLYHYGFSLLKLEDDRSRKKSRYVLGNLVNKLSKNDPIYKYVKSAYKVSKKAILKPTKHKDVVLIGGQRKILDEPVFEDANVEKLQIDSIKDLLPKYDMQALEKSKRGLWMNYNYVQDSSDNHIDEYGLGIDNLAFVSGVGIGFNVSRYIINNLTNHIEINRYKIHASTKKIKVGLGFNQFKNFDEVVPFVEYHDVFGRHHISTNLSYENGVFYNYDNNSPYLVNNQIKTAHFYVMDNVRVGFDRDILFELNINSFEDKNIQYAPGVRIPIFISDNFEWVHKVELYSTINYNTKDDLPYVREKIEDLSTLELSTKYRFASDSYVLLGAGAGYSFKVKNSVYSAKAGVQYSFLKHYTVMLDCAYLYSENIYDSTQCSALMYYSW